MDMEVTAMENKDAEMYVFDDVIHINIINIIIRNGMKKIPTWIM